MAKFNFCQYVKVTLWQKQEFSVEAKSQEEADEIAKRYANVDIASDYEYDCEVELLNNENIWESSEVMSPEENNHCSTMEICNQYNEVIATNYDPIGYRVVNWMSPSQIPYGLEKYQLFRTKADAETWISKHVNKYLWTAEKVFPDNDDDIEEYEYLEV